MRIDAPAPVTGPGKPRTLGTRLRAPPRPPMLRVSLSVTVPKHGSGRSGRALDGVFVLRHMLETHLKSGRKEP